MEGRELIGRTLEKTLIKWPIRASLADVKWTLSIGHLFLDQFLRDELLCAPFPEFGPIVSHS